MFGSESKDESMGRRIRTNGNAPKRKEKRDGRLGGGLYLVAIIALIAVSVSLGVYFNAASTVQDIRVGGNHYTNADDIAMVSGIAEGANVDSLDYLEILDNVETLPYVKQAFVEVSSSGRVHLRVTEREPIMLLLDNGNRFYVDADGVRLPRIRGKSADVPIYYDLGYDSGKDVLDSRAFQEVRDFLMAARQNELVYLTLSEIGWTEDEGVTVLSHENTVRLVFGHENFDNAVENWSYFYTRVVPEKGMGHFRRIDFRFDGQIVTLES